MRAADFASSLGPSARQGTALRACCGAVLLVGAVLGRTAPAWADGLSATARLLGDEDKVERVVGRPLILEIEARHPPGLVALLANDLDLPDALGERRRARRHERRTEGLVQLDIYRLELIPFRPGLIEIPPLKLALGSTVAETAPILVTVESSLAEDEQEVASSTQSEAIAVLENMAAGNPPPEAVFTADYRIGLVVLSIAVLLLIAVLARKLLGTGKAEAKVPPPPPPRPAHELAFERLSELEKSGLAEHGDHNAYYTQLSFVLRSYLGDRYGFDALERTLDELTDMLERISTPGLDRVALKGLLSEADQIKFAKYRPRPEDVEEALVRARTMVEATRFDQSGPANGERAPSA